MIFPEIWRSFRALPLWVQIWVAFILGPTNLASLFFLSENMGGWVALLSFGAVTPNIAIMFYERGFSKMMAWPHLLPWSALVLWLLLAMPEGSAAYGSYLWILLAVDALSLAFDYPDAVKWLKGDRAIAGK